MINHTMTASNHMEKFLVENTCNVGISLKSEQEHVLKQKLDGKDIPAVLPTGFGKGHIFVCKAEDE